METNITTTLVDESIVRELADKSVASVERIDDVLGGIDRMEDYRALKGDNEDLARWALEREAKRRQTDVADRLAGESVIHERHGVGDVDTVSEPLVVEVIDDVVPVEAAFDHGVETVEAESLSPVTAVAMPDRELDPEEAHELLAVLDIGISALEDGADVDPAFAREFWDSIRGDWLKAGNPDETQ